MTAELSTSPISTSSIEQNKVKLPSIKELTFGLSPNQTQLQQVHSGNPTYVRHHSIGSASNTSPQQIYYHGNGSIISQNNSISSASTNASQPSLLLPVSNGSSISSASSNSGNESMNNSRKSSIVTPPYQNNTNTYPIIHPSHPSSNGNNYIIHAANPRYDMMNHKLQQNHIVNPFEQISTNTVPVYHYPQQAQPRPQYHQYSQHPVPQHLQYQLPQHSEPKKKRPRRKANEMERLYACNWKNCKNSYGTLNHLNAHITFKRHGPKRKPEEFKQIRELYKLKKTKLEKAKQEALESNKDIKAIEKSVIAEANIKLLANLSENYFDGKNYQQQSPNNGKVTDLPIFHQQKGYNGYGRHSYTLNQGVEGDKKISVNDDQ